MREILNEYGMLILECVGCSIIIGMLILFIFGGGFSEIVLKYLSSIIGGA